MRSIPALPALAAALSLTIAGVLALAFSPTLPEASAYVLANGCDEYDPERRIYYRCVPDRSTFYTPDGLNPSWIYPGTEGRAYGDDFGDGSATVNDGIMIPPPAPYRAGRDYCSNPWWAWTPFEGGWQVACYNHDVCYGSQKGRLYCDVTFWRQMVSACKSYGWYNPARYACFVDASDWYQAVRVFGGDHYKPRQTSFEPRGS